MAPRLTGILPSLTVLILSVWPANGRCSDQPDPPLTEAVRIYPAAGREKVNPITPDWCDGYTDRMKYFSNPVITVNGQFGGEYAEYVDRLEILEKIAWSACDDPRSPIRQQWVANWRQSIVNKIGWSESEDRAAMKIWALDPAVYKQKHQKLCEAWEPNPSAPPLELAKAKAKFAALQCSGSGSRPSTAPMPWTDPDRQALERSLDRDTEVNSELVRTTLVWDCLAKLSTGPIANPNKPRWVPGMQALIHCGLDARRLDKVRLENELASLGLDDMGKTLARESFGLAKRANELLSAEIREAVKQDPDLPALIFEGPEKAFAGWDMLRKANKPIFDAVRAIEEKATLKSVSAFAGCGKELRKLLDDYRMDQKPADALALMHSLEDPVTQALLAALAQCYIVEGQVERAMLLTSLLTGLQGPRMEVYRKTMEQVSALLQKRTDFPFKIEWFHAPYDRQSDAFWYPKVIDGKAKEEVEGEVKGVHKQGDALEITFKTQTRIDVQPAQQDCIETNKIDRVQNGVVHYRIMCKLIGKDIKFKIDITPKPVLIAEELASGIVPNTLISVRRELVDSKWIGVPIDVYADKTKKILLNRYGFPLFPK